MQRPLTTSTRVGSRAPTCRALLFCVLVAGRGAAADSGQSPSEVHVTGSLLRRPDNDESVAASIIPRERLSAPGAQAAALLRTQPGVAVTESGSYGALSTASIRGATSSQTPVYLAGICLNDDVSGTADLSLVPLWLIDRIEVYRGHAPLQADRLGIGGAIFFEPRRPSEAGTALGGAVGSFGYRAGWIHSAIGNERASTLAGVRWERAANDYAYLDDGGTRFGSSDDVRRSRANAEVSTVDVWSLHRSRFGERTTVDLLLNVVNRTQGIPGLSLYPTDEASGHLTRTLGGIRASTPCQQGGRCVIELGTSLVHSRSSFEDPRSEIALGTARLDVFGQRVEQYATVRWSLDEKRRLLVAPGVRAAVERTRRNVVGADGANAMRVFSRAHLQAHWDGSSHLRLHGLGSFECHGTSTDRASVCDQSEPTGRVGATVEFLPFRFFANGGRYARVPTLGELYGVSTAVRGNERLLAEDGWTADIGARVERKDWLSGAYLDAFVFLRQASNLLTYRRSALGYVRPYNTQNARVQGLEVLAGLLPVRSLTVEVALTIIDPRDTSDGRTIANDVLPYQSRMVVVPRIEWRTPRWRALGMRRGRCELRYAFQSNRYADPAGLVRIPEQGSLDTEVEVPVTEHFVVGARLANLLDQDRFDLIGYPLPGRSAYVSLESRW